MKLRWDYDPEADALSIVFAGGPSEGEEVYPGVMLHFDADNRLVEIEILPVSKILPEDVMEMRLCKDCRWAKGLERPMMTDEPYDYTCQHSTSVRISEPDYVLGQPQQAQQMRCYEARAHSRLCGPEGRYWEPRDEE
jgi:uncharacterized protein YuzE